jgi:hypothetical protein
VYSTMCDFFWRYCRTGNQTPWSGLLFFLLQGKSVCLFMTFSTQQELFDTFPILSISTWDTLDFDHFYGSAIWAGIILKPLVRFNDRE